MRHTRMERKHHSVLTVIDLQTGSGGSRQRDGRGTGAETRRVYSRALALSSEALLFILRAA
jgi:hypothetical protein